MMRFARTVLSAFALCFLAVSLFAQTTETTISGIVTDPTGANVPNAHIHVTEQGTGQQFDVTTNTEGRYTVTSIAAGVYSVQASASGFKSKLVENAKVDVGTPLTVNIQLEIGSSSERVEVQAQATQVETETATVGTTVTGRQITELPFTSRDALDLALLTPGNSANGAPRQSSFNGLPHDALNITMDGVDTQDNLLKSSNGGGMYTYIRPRVDAIDEFNISSAVEGAQTSSEGAIQIQFVTKRGTNDFHGGLYEYFRNTDLDANYYFNNESGQPRQQLKLNQFGGKVGGPILKNKLFFFINAEGFELPESNARQRVTLTPTAASGIFTYTGSKDGQTHTINLLNLAAANGYPSTINPEIGGILGLINANIPNVGITPLSANQQFQNFNTTDTQKRDFVTARFDYNITEKLHFSFVYSYDYFYAFPDSLNSEDAPFPNFVTYNGYNTEGGQISNRFFGSTALQWTISPTMTNEIRAGLQGGTGVFETEINPQALPGGLRLTFPSINGNTIYSPVNRQPSQWRNTPVKQISDTLNWVKGNHTLSMGGNGTLVSFYGNTVSGLTPAITFGVTGTDPVASIFTNQTNFPGGIASTDTSYAETLYAFLTGRVSGASGQSEYLNENTKQYVAGAPLIERDRMHEFGFFLQDNWKLRPNFTVSGGLRWEFEGSPYDANNIYYTPTYAGLWGLSGVGNLFQPGVETGVAPSYIRNGKPDYFSSKLNNFAPNIGIAYSPHLDSKLVKWIFGKEGAFRAGYGISFIRDGIGVFEGTEGSNPGTSAAGTLTADTDFKAGSALLGSTLPSVTLFPSTAMDPLPASIYTFRGISGYATDPNLATPYVQSWSAGIQREVGKNTVLEVRYVGNHSLKLLRTYNLNEVNILTNGFLNDFKNAQTNLAINQAAGVSSFQNTGRAGEQNTPILTAAFKGLASSSGFGSGTFITDLQEGIAGTMANSLAGNQTYMNNLLSSGYPANFFQVNPTLAGANAYLTANGGFSNYNALQIEIRHRFSNSIQFSANYVYMKSMTDLDVDSSTDALNYVTLRNYSLNKTISPYNIPNQFKANFIYELPFGPGHAFSTNSGFINRIIGGWQFEGIIRIQSGSPFILNTGGGTAGRGTLNQYDAGIVTTLTRQQIQNDVGVYKMPNGTVYWLNPNANLVNITGNGQANAADLAPASTPGVLGNPYFYLYGPRFARFDLTAAKKTRISERMNLELRAEFLDAFNNVNFLVGSAGNSVNSTSILSSTFGRLTSGYQDISTTNDPGGRIIQLVGRFNF